jgi:hypothetical protein
MPKKYLLYIHDERFALEEEKSGLVNRLLEHFYSAKGLPVEPQTIKLSIPGVQKGADGIRPKQGKMCKHGQRGACRVPKCENHIDSY